MVRQCKLLDINRSTLYYQAKQIDESDINLMNEIKDIWLKIPFYGYRRITKELRHLGFSVNRKRVQRLMQKMGITAVYPKPKLSLGNKQHKIYPYLLKDLIVDRANQVWCVDITYLKVKGGFMYLVALIDLHSRYIVDWELTNTLETDGCLEILNRALNGSKPEIINSDQGSQFSDAKWVEVLIANGIKVSMDGKGRCLDNIYIERFWRSLKYEDFYLNDYQTVPELMEGIKCYIDFYNNRRWHQTLGYKTPASVYYEDQKKQPATMWTNPSDQPEPYGTYGQTMDKMLVTQETLLPTLLPTV
jgi:putative transposase